jgi:hypothetical protein
MSCRKKRCGDQQFLHADGVGPGTVEDVQDEPRESDLRGDLVWALDKLHVGKTEKNELLGALGPMKADIVEKR